MPFNLTQFKALLKIRNIGISQRSSMDALLQLMARPGFAINGQTLPQIQALWAQVPYQKQQKYSMAMNYLRQFARGLADAIPIDPKMDYLEFKVLQMPLDGQEKYPMRYYHVHELTWQSSNGHMPSLAKVGTRERVTARTSPAGPPFDPVINGKIPMTFTQGATTNNGAQIGSNKDDHSVGNPAIILRRPLVSGSVISDQVYEYTTDGIRWQPVPGAKYEIEKGVRDSGQGKVFYFRKQTVAPTNRPFHFEVEYPIGQPPTTTVDRVPVVSPGFVPLANLQDYASRIVSMR